MADPRKFARDTIQREHGLADDQVFTGKGMTEFFTFFEHVLDTHTHISNCTLVFSILGHLVSDVFALQSASMISAPKVYVCIL